MTRWQKAIALAAALSAIPAVAAADCLHLDPVGQGEPPPVIEGGTYPCIVIVADGAVVRHAKVVPAGDAGDGTGIVIYGSDVVLDHVTVRGFPGHGISIRCRNSKDGVCDGPPARVRILDSTITDNGMNGIKWDGCAECEASRNAIMRNKNSGAHANDPVVHLLFEGNEVSHNGNWIEHYGHGIYFGGRSNRVLDNRIHHNQGWGLHFWPGPVSPPDDPYIVRGNRVWKNGGGTVIAAKVEHFDYRNNEEFDNGSPVAPPRQAATTSSPASP